MGNENSAQAQLGVRYASLNLPQPQEYEYESNFEKELFYAINLLRHDPKSFVVQV